MSILLQGVSHQKGPGQKGQRKDRQALKSEVPRPLTDEAPFPCPEYSGCTRCAHRVTLAGLANREQFHST